MDASTRQHGLASEWESPIPLNRVDVPEFPVTALTGWLRDFVEAEAVATQTPPDLTALLSLAICGYACSKKVIVRVRDGFEEPVNLYTVTALGPANRKSAVFRDVIAPVEEAEREAVTRLAPEVALSLSQQRVAQEALHRAEQDAAKAALADGVLEHPQLAVLTEQLAAMKITVSPKFIVQDCSPERLATLLSQQGGRIAVCAPEGDIFDIMAGRYSSSGAGNFTVFLQGHAGDAIRVDRVGRPSDLSSHPALTIALAVQPDVLRGLIQKPGFLGRGLLARFLYAMPVSLLGRRQIDAPPVPADVREAYRRGVRAILDLPAAGEQHGEPIPHALCLDEEASDRLRDFETWIEPHLGEFEELSPLSDWAGKLVGAIVRIVGIVRVVEDPRIPDSGMFWINGDQMDRAIQIGRYLIPHARAAYGEMGGDPVVGEAAHVLAWIRQQGQESFTKRNVFNALKGRFKRVGEIEPALSLLTDHYYIRPRVSDSVRSAGRPASPVYEVNPGVLEHNPHNPHNSIRPVQSGVAGVAS